MTQMVLPTNKAKGRDPVKREEILSYIRGQVLSGAWKPGEKLPPRTWFEQKFDAAPLTVQRSFRILIDDKVLISEKRIGTRVSLRQPHLSRYGVLLYGSRKLESVFSQVLVKALDKVAGELKIDVDCFFVLGLTKNAEDYQRLLYGIENSLFAGLFFATIPNSLAGTPIVCNTLPKMAIGRPEASFPGLPTIDLDTDSVLTEVLRYFSKSGCRRIAAVLAGEKSSLEHCRAFRKEAEEFGLEAPPGNVLELSAVSPFQVRPLMHLLFSPDNRRMPEGLYIGDDNFLPHVIDILRERFGADAEKKVKLVSQVNFPRLTDYDFPVKFFGFDLADMFARSIRAMREFRRNLKEPLPLSLKPIEDFSMDQHTTKKEGTR